MCRPQWPALHEILRFFSDFYRRNHLISQIFQIFIAGHDTKNRRLQPATVAGFSLPANRRPRVFRPAGDFGVVAGQPATVAGYEHPYED